MVMPAEITVGETLNWDNDELLDELGNQVTSTDWTLIYSFRGPASVTLTAAQNGSGWRTSTTTSSFATPGTYYWQATLTKGSPTVTDRKVHSSGRIVVKRNLADVASANYDGRSQERIDLDNVQAAIRTLISGAVKSYTIGTRSLTKLDLPELIARESQLKAIVVKQEKAEAIAAGLGNPNNLFVRFGKR